MKYFIFGIYLILMSSVKAQPTVVTFQSTGERTALLELYTSEGCSSCPPAETWLSGLKESPGLWKDFVPVAFHVDYWDYLGWRDPWAQRGFSDRQRAYAESWHSENVYTPGFVLNGKECSDSSGRNAALKPSGAKAGVLTVSSSDTNRWQVSFAPTNAEGQNFEIHAALLGSDLSSDVKAGENQGRRLKHDFAVLTLVNAGLARNHAVAQGDFVLTVPRITAGTNVALAVWVTRAGSLEPLQATGGWLVRPVSIR